MKYRLHFILFFCISFSYQVTDISAQGNVEIKSDLILQTTTSWDGSPIAWPEGEALITVLHIEIPSGAETGWHYHPVPSFAYVLEGTLELKLEDGSTLIVNEGEALAEVTNTIHSGKSIGENSLRLVVFYTGITEKELTILKNDRQ